MFPLFSFESYSLFEQDVLNGKVKGKSIPVLKLLSVKIYLNCKIKFGIEMCPIQILVRFLFLHLIPRDHPQLF